MFEKDTIIIAAHKKIPKLFEQERSGKIQLIDKHICAAVCGIISDSNQLVDQARYHCQEYLQVYDEPIGVEKLVYQIADTKHEMTQYGGLRPYGVSMLIAGYDSGYKLFMTDPSGNFSQWSATSIGKASADINSRLKTFIRNLNAEVSLKDAKEFAIRSLAKAVDKIDYNADNIEVVVVRFVEGRAQIEYLEAAEINQWCDVIKLEGDDAFGQSDEENDESQSGDDDE